MTRSTCDRRVLVLGLMVSLWGVGGVRAATFTVTTTADSGAGSLRQGLLDADASPDPDTITFDIPGGGEHTITLASPLTVASDVTIDGTSQPGYAGTNVITISGNDTCRVLDVTTGTVAIQGLTIIGGNTLQEGGGVRNAATLTLTNCTISGNGAYYVGGGICHEYALALTLNGCTVSGNTAYEGGGIYCQGNGLTALTMTNCTLSGNITRGGEGSSIYGDLPPARLR